MWLKCAQCKQVQHTLACSLLTSWSHSHMHTHCGWRLHTLEHCAQNIPEGVMHTYLAAELRPALLLQTQTPDLALCLFRKPGLTCYQMCAGWDMWDKPIDSSLCVYVLVTVFIWLLLSFHLRLPASVPRTSFCCFTICCKLSPSCRRMKGARSFWS